MAGRIEVCSDNGDYYVVTEQEAWEQAKASDSPWLFESFLERAVYITDEEDAEWKRLYDLKREASVAYYNYVCQMGTLERPREPEPDYGHAPVVLRELDPELERLLDEEEEIDRRHQEGKGLPCMKHNRGASCMIYGEHTTHRDRYGNQWARW